MPRPLLDDVERKEGTMKKTIAYAALSALVIAGSMAGTAPAANAWGWHGYGYHGGYHGCGYYGCGSRGFAFRGYGGWRHYYGSYRYGYRY